MSLRTFTDNLINLVIESCLVQALPSIFTSRDVVDMSDGKVDELAAEPKEAADYRSQLKEDIKLLEQGRAQCRRYQPRHTASECSRTVPLPWGLSNQSLFASSYFAHTSTEVQVPYR